MVADGTAGAASSPKRGGAVVRALVAACLLLLSVSGASAQDAADEQVARMETRLWFVERLRRGAGPMLADLAKDVGPSGTSGDPRLRAVRDRLKEILVEGLGDAPGEAEERKVALLAELAAEAVDPVRRTRSRDAAVALRLRRAERFEQANDDTRALAELRLAREIRPDEPEIYQRVARIGLRQADRLVEAGDYDAAFALLDQWKDDFPADAAAQAAREQFTARRRKIEAETGLVRIAWFVPASGQQVGGAVNELRGGELLLRPRDGQRAPPPRRLAELRKELRVSSGAYDVTVAGSAGEYRAGTVTVPSQSGTARLPLIAVAPKDMVLVPSVEGRPPFLIDVYEVTEGVYRNGPGAGGERRAQGGVRFDEAVAWAKRFGRTLPTEDQWKTAAFWDPATSRMREYPWGSAAPRTGTHWIGGGQPGPSPVGSAPAGVSALGCHDMAGNIAEWVREARFLGGKVVGPGCLGGSFAGAGLRNDFSVPGLSLAYDSLRDAKPSNDVFQAQIAVRAPGGARAESAIAFEKSYEPYREDLSEGPKDATIGFRTVVELKEE